MFQNRFKEKAAQNAGKEDRNYDERRTQIILGVVKQNFAHDHEYNNHQNLGYRERT